MQTEQQKEIAKILNSNGFDFIDAFEIEQWHKDGDDIQEQIQERITEQDIIYYHKAIDYLRENDASLQESCSLAHDAGYTADKLNSELLATLLYQNNLFEKLDELIKELEDFEFVQPVEEGEEV